MVEVTISHSLKIIGEYTLIHKDGTKEIVNGKRSFCRCGLSETMPYCDSTHRSKDCWVRKTEDT